MMQPSPRTAFITGASSGIGLELARLLAADGHRLFITARKSTRFDAAAHQLRAIATAGLEALPDDLADPAAPARLALALRERQIVPDLLINNAGFGIHGRFAETDDAQILQMIQVNVSALVHLTHLILPGMLARRSGRIMNIASTAAFQPGPYMAIYYATKSFVLSFSEALNYEVKTKGLTVTAVCPGPTTTDFQNRAGVANSPMFENNTMTAAAVARLGYEATLRGRAVVVTGTKNKLLAFATRFAPRSAATAVAGKLNSNRSANSDRPKV